MSLAAKFKALPSPLLERKWERWRREGGEGREVEEGRWRREGGEGGEVEEGRWRRRGGEGMGRRGGGR